MRITNGAQVRLIWTYGTGQLGFNVLGAIVSGTVTFNLALANALDSALKTAFTTHLASKCATSTQLVRVGVRDLRADNQPEFRGTGAAAAGTAVGDPLPVQVATCITLRTAMAGRSFRGRVYLGGFAESENDTTGLSLAATNTAALAFLNAVDAAMASNGLPLAVLSRPAERYQMIKRTFLEDGTEHDEIRYEVKQKTGVATDVISLESRSNIWETQRRRNNARGGAPPALFLQSQAIELTRG